MSISITYLPPQTELVGSAMFRLLVVVAAPVMLVGVWKVTRGVFGVVRRILRGRDRGRCLMCGYDVSGIAAAALNRRVQGETHEPEPRCPECGDELTEQWTLRRGRLRACVRRAAWGAVLCVLYLGVIFADRVCERKGGVVSTGDRGRSESQVGGWERLWPAWALDWAAMHVPLPTTLRTRMVGGLIEDDAGARTESSAVDWKGALDPGWIGIEASNELLRRAQCGELPRWMVARLVDRLAASGSVVDTLDATRSVPKSMVPPNDKLLREIVMCSLRRGELDSVQFERLVRGASRLSVAISHGVSGHVIAHLRLRPRSNDDSLDALLAVWPELQNRRDVERRVDSVIYSGPEGGERESDGLPTLAADDGVGPRTFTIRWRFRADVNLQSLSDLEAGTTEWNGMKISPGSTSIQIPPGGGWYVFETKVDFPGGNEFLAGSTTRTVSIQDGATNEGRISDGKSVAAPK